MYVQIKTYWPIAADHEHHGEEPCAHHAPVVSGGYPAPGYVRQAQESRPYHLHPQDDHYAECHDKERNYVERKNGLMG